ncbi:MAG: GNAT family N-acetyltransferase [Candidatus Paceibacterota bacterium]|nr:MAG: GNAT family N-acetyltransferase [Candidatus Paceibacterota bacterium]
MSFVISLSPVSVAHFEQLLAWRNQDDFVRFVTHRKYAVSSEVFARELAHDFECDRKEQFLCSTGTGVPCGTAIIYEDGDRTQLLVSVFIDTQFRHAGYGILATVAAVEYAFRYLRAESVRFDVCKENKNAAALLRRCALLEQQHASRKDLISFVITEQSFANILRGSRTFGALRGRYTITSQGG